MKPVTPKQKPADRRGAVVMMALVCLVVATTLILASVQISLHQQRHVRNELQLEQTKWLLDAGVRRATAQIHQQPGYDGESIQVSGGLKHADQATVNISLVREAESSQATVTVEAVLGSVDEIHPTTRRSMVFEMPFEPRSQ